MRHGHATRGAGYVFPNQDQENFLTPPAGFAQTICRSPRRGRRNGCQATKRPRRNGRAGVTGGKGCVFRKCRRGRRLPTARRQAALSSKGRNSSVARPGVAATHEGGISVRHADWPRRKYSRVKRWRTRPSDSGLRGGPIASRRLATWGNGPRRNAWVGAASATNRSGLLRHLWTRPGGTRRAGVRGVARIAT